MVEINVLWAKKVKTTKEKDGSLTREYSQASWQKKSFGDGDAALEWCKKHNKSIFGVNWFKGDISKLSDDKLLKQIMWLSGDRFDGKHKTEKTS